ncbi:protein translocase subunit SecF [Actinopolymorpha sp. B11F2]|uniref:protein translocase subunit SecF n=1 Tax=Actinopolymorpha sp. B11F2 TaxID=3160862 RepID=UPI0032E4AE7F
MSRLGTLGHRLYTGEVSIGFIGRRRWWYLISVVLTLLAIGAVLLRGLNFSIEFRGGVDFQAPVSSGSAGVAIAPVREAVADVEVTGASEPIITAVGDRQIRVETPPLTNADISTVRKAIGESLDVPAADVAYSSIGPTWGGQITDKALISLAVFLCLVMVVIWGYFREWRMSISGLVALLHDVVITVGIYALVGFDVTPATVIGLLTILGYSLYDTVVVFDKVRENTRGLVASARSTYSEAANLAVNQTLVRSINTSVIALLPVAGILFVGAGLLGAGTLKDLALALFIGIAAGTYSSIFIATPLLCDLKEREPAMRALSRRAEQRRRPGGKQLGAPVVVTTAGDGDPTGSSPLVAAQLTQPTQARGSVAVAAGRAQPQRRSRSARRSKGRGR